jgi:MFS family permease
LIGVLLVIGFAALVLYPNYYAFSQDLTVRHQGKVTGMLSCINWLAMAGLHIVAGKSVEYVGYSWGVALAGLAPLVGLLALLLLWGRPRAVRREVQVVEAQPVAPSEQIKAAH